MFQFAQSQESMEHCETVVNYCDGHCGLGYCFQAIYTPDDGNLNYTLYAFEGGAPLGWYGVAQGTGMIGANMVVNWVNADLTLTTSHRSTTAYRMPLTSDVTVKTFSINPFVEKTIQNLTIWSWNMPIPKQDSQDAVQHVFAHSPISPQSSSVDAIIRKHDRHDVGIALNLTIPCIGRIAANLTGKVSN